MRLHAEAERSRKMEQKDGAERWSRGRNGSEAATTRGERIGERIGFARANAVRAVLEMPGDALQVL